MKPIPSPVRKTTCDGQIDEITHTRARLPVFQFTEIVFGKRQANVRNGEVARWKKAGGVGEGMVRRKKTRV